MSQQVNETKQIAAFLLKEIDRLIDRPVRIMEVCGTHTVSISCRNSPIIARKSRASKWPLLPCMRYTK